MIVKQGFGLILMMVVKRVYTVFWETVGKMWEPFWSPKAT